MSVNSVAEQQQLHLFHSLGSKLVFFTRLTHYGLAFLAHLVSFKGLSSIRQEVRL